MKIHSNYESEFMSMVLSAVENLVNQRNSRFMLNNNNNNNGNESSNFNGIFLQNETLFATHNQLLDTNYTNVTNNTELETERQNEKDNYWALLAIFLVIGTACGNILVCLAIAWEKRLQNVTNYFLASLAITDLMVAILVMPLGILTLYRGYFPLQSYHCLIWVCLDVLFCTSSIMHLCTISIDRYLSLRYPMRFGRNKTRKRVVLKIFFVWLLSIAMSLPLSLMYSKNHASVLVDGTCQIPDPWYKLIGSIVCFYIPLLVMLLTYTLTVRLLARQRQSLGGCGSKVTTGGWSGWMGAAAPLERKTTWRRFIKSSVPSTPNHAHSAGSTDTELSTLDINTQELWLPESSIPEPTPSTMAALHTFGAEMLKLSRGLDSFTPVSRVDTFQSDFSSQADNHEIETDFESSNESKHHKIVVKPERSSSSSTRNVNNKTKNNDRNKKIAATLINVKQNKRRASLNVYNATKPSTSASSSMRLRHRSKSIQVFEREQRALDDEFFYELKRHKKKQHKKNDGDSTSLELPPPVCTCPYFGDKPSCTMMKPIEVKIITTSSSNFLAPERASIHSKQQQNESNQFISISSNSISNTPSTVSLPLQSSLNRVHRKQSYTKCNAIVTWDSRHSYHRRGSNLNGSTRTTLLAPTQPKSNLINPSPLRRSATLRHNNNNNNNNNNNIMMNSDENSTSVSKKIPSSPCILQRATTIRSHHSRNSSVISRNSARHGRIIRLEQKATKVLGVVFFTFVILWAPFFVLNLLPTVCPDCESNISQGVFDFVTWLGYASSCVNPIFYSCFNNVFRQAFKKVLMCQYKRNSIWRPPSLNHTHR